MVRLTISVQFQQFEDLKFRIFSGRTCPPTPPPQKNPCRVSKRPELGGIVPILLENPESRLNFSRNTGIPILNNSSHKPTSREIYFGKIVIIFVIVKLGYPGEFRIAVMINDASNTKSNHITRLACSVGGLVIFPTFPNQTFCC